MCWNLLGCFADVCSIGRERMKNILDIKLLLKSFVDIQQQVLKQQELDLRRMIQEIKFQKEYMQIMVEELDKPIKLVGRSEADEIKSMIASTLHTELPPDDDPVSIPEGEKENIIQFPLDSSTDKNKT